MSTITVVANYNATATGVADLGDKTWDDVNDWYIKWDNLYIQFNGSKDYQELELDSKVIDGIDWKRPDSSTIYKGENEYNDELSSQG